MAITDLFSKRQKRLRGEIPEIFTYDHISDNLRVRIVHIIRDAFGEDRSNSTGRVKKLYKLIHDTLCREYGYFKLTTAYETDYEEHVIQYLLMVEETERVLDVIELCFKCIDKIIREDYHSYYQQAYPKVEPDEAITELNERFKEEGVGYAFEKELLKLDSTYVHQNITKPTIALLWNPKFQGANDEYLSAHEHFRHGRNKECLADCLKALESVLKIICKEKKWLFKETDTSRKLIQIVFQNNLVPSFTQNQFTSLQNLIESGIPTIRNRLGGHGQGQITQKVDDEITKYGLNLTGTNIIFLIKQSGIN